MQREEQRRRSRAAILDAAGTQFERSGYAATSLADVAAELGMVRGTVHFHFATKDGLVKALASHLDDVWNQLVVDSRSSSASPREAVIAFSHSLVDAIDADPKVRGALRLAREHPCDAADMKVLAGRFTSFAETIFKGQGKRARAELATGTVLGLIDLHHLAALTDIHARLDAAWSILPA